MRIKIIEFEATGEEIRTNRTLLEAITDMASSITRALNKPKDADEDDDREDDTDDEQE